MSSSYSRVFDENWKCDICKKVINRDLYVRHSEGHKKTYRECKIRELKHLLGRSDDFFGPLNPGKMKISSLKKLLSASGDLAAKDASVEPAKIVVTKMQAKAKRVKY
ncbi:unnamed protein product [Linum tenue]|uniref:Uncharacterized protein n=1 Tax=Linum tenue TaxID=586396 RepID=A0AAV0HVN3_9ROSI|nr:unnamed protein product [Linum tenue]